MGMRPAPAVRQPSAAPAASGGSGDIPVPEFATEAYGGVVVDTANPKSYRPVVKIDTRYLNPPE